MFGGCGDEKIYIHSWLKKKILGKDFKVLSVRS